MIGIKKAVARWLAPDMESGRRRFLRESDVVVPAHVHPGGVTFEDKVMAAVYIAAHGADGAGIRTWSTLMHPLKEFTLDDVDVEASVFLGRALLVALAEAPQSLKTQNLQDQAERLSFE